MEALKSVYRRWHDHGETTEREVDIPILSRSAFSELADAGFVASELCPAYGYLIERSREHPRYAVLVKHGEHGIVNPVAYCLIGYGR